MILFIDGSSLLSTNYYATLPKEILYEKDEAKKEALYSHIMHSEDGRYTNGVLGFMRMLTNMLEKQKPTHVYIAFDKTRATFRRDLYADYKGQRKATPSPLKEQFITIEELLKDCGFVMDASESYEADDLVGSAVEKFKDVYSIRIWTKDQDYFQLLDNENGRDVRIWMPMDKEKIAKLNESYCGIYGYNAEENWNIPNNVFEFSADMVEDYFGVEPKLVADYKGIAGDSSDNIPGVKGVSSAAIPLLKEYGSVEGIYEAIDECNGDPKEEKTLNEYWKNSLGVSRSPLKAMKENREMALLSKKLATIKRDCNLSWNINDLSVFNINNEKLDKWYAELGMNSLRK